MASMLPGATPGRKVGPHPSFIQVSKQYMTEFQIQRAIKKYSSDASRESISRLQGVAWIDNVRKALNLPYRTFNTAVVLYIKFRLQHSDSSYNHVDAAAAALFNACKVEDTLKKSKEILCAAYNLRQAPSERLIPDNAVIRHLDSSALCNFANVCKIFDGPSKTVIGLERLILEGYGFDFRTRHPNVLANKLMKHANFHKETTGLTGNKMALDLYRTFAPLKQTCATLALAVVELTARFHQLDLKQIRSTAECNEAKWNASRAEILETIHDLLDLYTHNRAASLIGPDFTPETYISTRLEVNREADHDTPRYMGWPENDDVLSAPSSAAKATPSTDPTNGKQTTSTAATPKSPADVKIEERTRDSTVRFMLDPQQARAEQDIVKEYHELHEEEVYV